MKKLVILLALAAATPALSQTPDAGARTETPATENVAFAAWEFTPDFSRDQNRIVWSAPDENGAREFFATTTSGAGEPVSETISFLDARVGKLKTLNATFDKKGRLQNLFWSDGLLADNSLNKPTAQTELNVGNVSLQTSANKGLLKQRIFKLDLPNLKGTLTSDYDARGRRQRDTFSRQMADSRRGVYAVNYLYDARGLSQITDGTTTTTIERDADGKMRALSAIQNGLLTRSATPIKNDKGAIIGTRTEDYASGVLQEVNELTREGGAKNSRVSQSSSDKTIYENGQQSNKKKFEFRVDISPPRTPDVAAVETRKRTLYRNAKIATEEIYRGGVLTQRSAFNDNGIIAKITNFNADGSVASETDASAIPYANGGIIRNGQ